MSNTDRIEPTAKTAEVIEKLAELAASFPNVMRGMLLGMEVTVHLSQLEWCARTAFAALSGEVSDEEMADLFERVEELGLGSDVA